MKKITFKIKVLETFPYMWDDVYSVEVTRWRYPWRLGYHFQGLRENKTRGLSSMVYCKCLNVDNIWYIEREMYLREKEREESLGG